MVKQLFGNSLPLYAVIMAFRLISQLFYSGLASKICQERYISTVNKALLENC